MTVSHVIRGARIALSIAFAALAVCVLAIGLSARLAPALGFELFAIRSGSMQPALPVGSLAVVSADVHSVEVGQAVAYRLPSGVVVTHRAVEVVRVDGETFVRTKGDANRDPDPSLVPAASVVGGVVLNLPLLGFVLAMLGMPIGIVAILSMAGSLLTAILLLEEVERHGDRKVSGDLPAARPEGALR